MTFRRSPHLRWRQLCRDWSAMLFMSIMLFLSTIVHAQEVRAQSANAQATKKTAKKPIKKVSESVVMYAAGDIADCNKKPAPETVAMKTAEIILQGLNAQANAVVLTLGDNTYPIGHPDEYAECYEPTWGKFKTRTLPTPGNHDYGVPLAYGYYEYFDELAGPDQRGYYVKRLGNWHVFSLNSNVYGADMRKQLDWLRQQLNQLAAANKASTPKKSQCILAAWHHPVFSSGGHGNIDTMREAWQLLAKAKADLVLSAHDHDYERFAPLNSEGERDDKNGIRSFVVGTGGARLTPMFFAKATTEVRSNKTNGVLKLTLHPTSYDWEFIPIEGESFTDKGQATCH